MGCNYAMPTLSEVMTWALGLNRMQSSYEAGERGAP